MSHDSKKIGTKKQEADILEPIRTMVSACMQCGTCTASCPNAFAMDLTPRQLWKYIQLGFLDEVLASRTFWMCSSCYACTLRCPRGLQTTEAMAALKRLAAENEPSTRPKIAFYRAFMADVRHNGRVRETDMMMRYFLSRRDPLLPLKHTPLALKLLRKGKLHLPGKRSGANLKAIFDKVAAMEERV